MTERGLGRRPAAHARHAARQRCARRSALPHPAQRRRPTRSSSTSPEQPPRRLGRRCSTRAFRAASCAARPAIARTPAERFPLDARSLVLFQHAPAAAGDLMRRVHSMPFGAEVTDDGVRFALLGADSPRGRARARRDARMPMPAAESGWRRLIVPEARAGEPLPLPHRRRPHGAGPGLALPARRRAPGRACVVDPRAFDWSDGAWTRPAVGRGGDLRGACRHGDAGGHLCRARREARGAARPRRHRDRADAARRFPGPAELGLRRRSALRAGLEPTARPTTSSASSTAPMRSG